MHDTVDLEARGVPAVFVATVEFVDGAEAQAKALGADPASVFVPHPMWNRTDNEVVEIADNVLDELISALVEEPVGD